MFRYDTISILEDLGAAEDSRTHGSAYRRTVSLTTCRSTGTAQDIPRFVMKCLNGGWFSRHLCDSVEPTTPAAAAEASEDIAAVDGRSNESLTELSTHRAVENEVDGVVDQSHHVEQVAERPVDAIEELGVEDTAEG